MRALTIPMLVLVPATAQAQNYVPMPAEGIVIGQKQIEKSADNKDKSMDWLKYLACSDIPKLADLTNSTFSQTTMDISAAADANFPVGSFKASAAKKVFIQEWIRTDRCMATDNKTELVYGQSIRIVAGSEGYEAEGNLSLAALAANATLNKKNTRIEVQIIGFQDSQLNAIASNIYGEFDVEKFSKVENLIQQLRKRADEISSGGKVVALGLAVPKTEPSAYPVGAYALQQIANRQSCANTKSDLAPLSDAMSKLVGDIYTEFTGACDGNQPNRVSEAKAEVALQGFRIKHR